MYCMLETCEGASYDGSKDDMGDKMITDKIINNVKVFKVGDKCINKSILNSGMIIGLDTLASVSIFTY